MAEHVDIKMITKKYREQLYANKSDDLDEMDMFLEIDKLPKFIQ